MTLSRFLFNSKPAASAIVLAAIALISSCGEPPARTASTPSTKSEATADVTPSFSAPPFTSSPTATESTAPAASPTEALPPPAQDENGNPLPRLIETGTVTFQAPKAKEAIELPLIGVEVSYGVDHGDPPPSILPPEPLPVIAFSIPAKQAPMLAAYWMNLGFDQGFLVIPPKDWIAKGAAAGANGSFGIDLVNPKDSREGLTTSDTAGGCQGCAVSDIGSYFPKLSMWAEDQSFPGTPKPYLNFKMVNEHEIEYELKNENKSYVTRGAAFERHENGAWFGHVEISISEDKNDLAQTMLSYYEFTNANKRLD